MNERQRKFCDCYLANGMNATAAYKEAGYNPKSDDAAKACAHKLLTNAYVQEYVNNHMSEVVKQAEEHHESKMLEAEDLLRFLSDVIRGNEKDAENKDVKMSDKLKALELLGKAHNMFNTTNVNVATPPIVIHDNVRK